MQIMTSADVAKYFKTSERVIIRMAEKGELHGLKTEEGWRFHIGYIAGFIKTEMKGHK